MKNLLTCTLVTVLAFASGCGLDTQDPLLFDEDGMVRTSVNVDDVDAAGIPSCIDVEGFDAADGEIVIPVEGSDEEAVLIGFGGQALCIGDGDEDPGDIDDVGDEVKPDEDHPVILDGDDEGDDDSGVVLQPREEQPADGQGLGNAQRPMLRADPTPEPATT